MTNSGCSYGDELKGTSLTSQAHDSAGFERRACRNSGVEAGKWSRRSRRRQVEHQLYRQALAALIIPTAGSAVAVMVACQTGVGLMEISLLAVMFVLTCLGISVAFHRHLTHKSFKAKPIARALLIVFGCMAAEGPPIYWAAVHRHHHAHSDEGEDPHSPYRFGSGTRNLIRGLWYAHVGWMLDHPVIKVSFYVRDLLEDSLVRTINDWYYLWVLLGLALPAAIGWLITGTALGGLKGFLWGGMVRLFLLHHFTWSVNSVCHVFGKRPFPTNDGSANNGWLAIPTMGESWHNNHHAFPYSALFGLRSTEIDIGGWAVRLLETCRLAWDVQVPAPAAIARRRQHNDLE